jgi:hypothetical protein
MNRKNSITFIKKYYPFLTFLLVYLFIFRKIFLSGLVPYPSDLLVSFFFPYNSGGWEGYQAFVAHKEFIASDVVRQIYPWRILAMDLFKSGEIPLWNPYAFAGTPLLANIQSAVFYPLNILFFFFSNTIAWLIYVLLQPVLAFISMYVFIRSLKLGKEAALFSGIAYGFIGYTMIWFELGVVGHTALWLPLALFGINRFIEEKNQKFLLITVLSLTCVLLAGHAQTAVYIFIVTFAYFLFSSWQKISLKGFMSYGALLLLPIGLAAIQLLPSIELLSFAARNAASSSEVFYRLQLPVQHLIMLFAPDFFGNPAAKNFWGVDYNEFLSYVGIVALVFSFVGIFSAWNDARVRFFALAGLIALLFALPTPLSDLLQIVNVPVLGTGIPARSIFVLEFSLVVLAAYGMSQMMRGKYSVKPVILLGGVYALIWGIVLGMPSIIPDLAEHTGVAIRNLIIPSILFAVVAMAVLLIRYRPSLKYILFAVLICCAAFEYQYLMYKYLPFAPVSYIFPNHPIVSKLQKVSGISRIYGYDTARIDTNFPTAWHLYSPEGYDPLYLRRYGELMYASQDGEYRQTIPRSDATFALSLPAQDSSRKQLLMNLMNVRYITAKTDQAAEYPADRFRMIWQKEKWKIYENTKTLPRAAVYYNWITTGTDAETIRDLFQKDFPYQTTLLLPSGPEKAGKIQPVTPVEISYYSANKVMVQASTHADGMLFLPDAYVPGWKAEVDGKDTPIYPADHAFRAVPVRTGNHTIIFQYEPLSFTFGAIITGISGLIFIGILGLSVKGGKYHAKEHKKT